MRFKPGKLYSLLDILGCGYTCDGCGRKSESGLTPELLASDLRRKGWFIEDGLHHCPTCYTADPQPEIASDPDKMISG